jgi:hypothetical protein
MKLLCCCVVCHLHQVIRYIKVNDQNISLSVNCKCSQSHCSSTGSYEDVMVTFTLQCVLSCTYHVGFHGLRQLINYVEAPIIVLLLLVLRTGVLQTFLRCTFVCYTLCLHNWIVYWHSISSGSEHGRWVRDYVYNLLTEVYFGRSPFYIL